jgi:hypothetical protein
MSVVHIVNSQGAAAVEAAEEAENGVQGTNANTAAALDGVAETNSLLCLLNNRFEEAFKTGLSNEDD